MGKILRDSGVASPPFELSSHTDANVLRNLRDDLRPAHESVADPAPVSHQRRTSSSSYPSVGIRGNRSGAASPEPHTRNSSLDMNRLSKYHSRTSRISDLRSSSGSSVVRHRQPSGSRDSQYSGTSGAVPEAREAVTGLTEQLDPVPSGTRAPCPTPKTEAGSCISRQVSRSSRVAPESKTGRWLSEVTTVSDTTGVSLRPIRGHWSIDDNPLEENKSGKVENKTEIESHATLNVPPDFSPPPNYPPRTEEAPTKPALTQRKGLVRAPQLAQEHRHRKPGIYFARAKIAFRTRQARLRRWMRGTIDKHKTALRPYSLSRSRTQIGSLDKDLRLRRRGGKRDAGRSGQARESDAPLLRTAQSVFNLRGEGRCSTCDSERSVNRKITQERNTMPRRRPVSLQGLNRKMSVFSFRSLGGGNRRGSVRRRNVARN